MDKEGILTEEFNEVFWDDLKITEEDADDEKRMKIEAVLQKADAINLNNRIYPKSVLSKAVTEMQPNIKSGKVFGELDHPSYMAQLKDTSHLLTKVFWDEKDDSRLIGEILVTNTPNGKILKEIIHAGGRPGISSRGRGQMMLKKLKGGGEVNMVKPGFRFSSFDFVIDPSVKSAQITKVVEENLDASSKDAKIDSNTKKWYENYFVDETTQKNQKEDKNMTKEEKDKIAADLKKVEDQKKADQKKADEKNVDADSAAELEKLRKEKEGLETQIATKDEEIEKCLKVITNVVESVEELTLMLQKNAYMKIPEEKQKSNDSKKDEALVNLETKVVNLEQELDNTKDNLQKSEVASHITDVLKSEPFSVALEERLKKCKTVAEVDAKLEEDKKLVKEIMTEGEILASGKGRVKVDGEDEVKKDAKRLAGIKEEK